MSTRPKDAIRLVIDDRRGGSPTHDVRGHLGDLYGSFHGSADRQPLKRLKFPPSEPGPSTPEVADEISRPRGGPSRPGYSRARRSAARGTERRRRTRPVMTTSRPARALGDSWNAPRSRRREERGRGSASERSPVVNVREGQVSSALARVEASHEVVDENGRERARRAPSAWRVSIGSRAAAAWVDASQRWLMTSCPVSPLGKVIREVAGGEVAV